MPPQTFEASGSAKADFSHKSLEEISLFDLQEELLKVEQRKKSGRWLAGLTGAIDGSFDVAAILAIIGIIAAAIVGTTILLTPVGWAAMLGIVVGAALLTLAGGALGSYMYVRWYEDDEQDKETTAFKEVIALQDKIDLLNEFEPVVTEKSADEIYAEKVYLKCKQTIEKAFADDETAKNLALTKLDDVYTKNKKTFLRYLKQDSQPTELIEPPAEESTWRWLYRNFSLTGQRLDATDKWSRRLRNVFTMGLILVEVGMVLMQGVAFVFNPIALGIVLAVAVGQLIPWVFKEVAVDKPRKGNMKKLKQLKKSLFVKERLLDEFEFFTRNIISETLSERLAPTLSIKNDVTADLKDEASLFESEAEEQLLHGLSLIKSPTSISDPDKSTGTEISSILIREKENAQRQHILGSGFATFLGFGHGALHAVAWFFIGTLIVSAFLVPPLTPILIAAACVAAVTGAVIAWREYQKERDSQEAELKAFDEAINATQEYEKQKSKLSALEDEAKDFDNVYKYYEDQISAKYVDKTVRENLIAELKSQKNIFWEQYNTNKDVLERKKTRDELSKDIGYYNIGFSIIEATQGKQPPIQRVTRDFWSLFNKPINGLSEIGIIDVGMVIITGGLWLIPIVVNLIKGAKIDAPREKNIEQCNELTNTLEQKTRASKEAESYLLMQRKKLANDYRKQAAHILNSVVGTDSKVTYMRDMHGAIGSSGFSTPSLPGYSPPPAFSETESPLEDRKPDESTLALLGGRPKMGRRLTDPGSTSVSAAPSTQPSEQPTGTFVSPIIQPQDGVTIPADDEFFGLGSSALPPRERSASNLSV